MPRENQHTYLSNARSALFTFPFHRTQPRGARSALLLSVCLTILLLGQSLSSWSAPVVLAASNGLKPLHLPAGTQTFQQFLKEGRHGTVTPYRLTGKLPLPPGTAHDKPGKLLPSAEPSTMKPLSATLDQAFLSATPGSQPLDLHSSDGRLEVQLIPGLFDLSHASVIENTKTGPTGTGSSKTGSGTGTKGKGNRQAGTPAKIGTLPPSSTPNTSSSSFSGSLTFTVTEQHGYYVGEQIFLGEYSFVLTDSHGHPVSGIIVRTPIILHYHYQEAVMSSLDLDPGHLFLGWPLVILNAAQHHHIDTAAMQPLQNDSKTHTLTTLVRSIGPGPFDLLGDPSNLSPPIPHLAGVQGNSGQLSYSYPLQTPPGTDGFGPDLQLSYSSETVNERHAYNQPSGPIGDGFSLSLGSITADVSSGTNATWYSISGVDGISDRLVPTQTSNVYAPQHLTYLKVNYDPTNKCFHVWDMSGTYYEFGCVLSAQQYHKDTNGAIHYYRWDLDKVIAPNEGDTQHEKSMTISYLQDCQPVSTPCPTASNAKGGTAIRDVSVKQITVFAGSTVVSTTDLFYDGPNTITDHGVTWETQYSPSYYTNCKPPATTSWRCDDPINYPGGLPAPQVMSTLSLENMVSYVGADTGGLPAYQYNFTYKDIPFNAFGIGSQCADPTQPPGSSQYYEYCAGEHLLTNLTESVYNSGAWHQLKPVLFDYTLLYNTYTDFTEQLPPGSGNAYHVKTAWQYLADYVDTNTGVGSHIVYMTGYGNTHGTPIVYNGSQIVDDRHDPTYCFQHASDCTGNFAGPDDGQWTVQVVTSISTLGSDSSQLGTTITQYSYTLADIPNPPKLCPSFGGENDCPVDTWRPLLGNDKDWQDFYEASSSASTASPRPTPPGITPWSNTSPRKDSAIPTATMATMPMGIPTKRIPTR